MAESEQTPNSELPTIQESLRILGKYGYRETAPETLRLMASQVEAELKDLQRQAVQLTEEVQHNLEAGDPHTFVKLKKKQTFLRGDIEDCLGREQRIENALEHQHLEAGMIKFLGSSRRLRLLEGIILSLIVLVLGLLIYDSTAADSGRPNWLSKTAIFWIDASCCLIFMIDFLMRRSCANSKAWFWRHHWIDFVTSIPVPGPAQLARFGRVARVARFARVLRFVRVFRAIRVIFLLWRGMDKLQDAMDVKLMKRSLKWGMAILLIGGLLVYQLEHKVAQEDSDVTSIGGGMWWSFTTLVTGGFGDIHNPQSPMGRVLTVLLVITGMILVGVFTATLTSLYVGEESEEMQQMQDVMLERLDRMERTIANLSKQSSNPDDT